MAVRVEYEVSRSGWALTWSDAPAEAVALRAMGDDLVRRLVPLVESALEAESADEGLVECSLDIPSEVRLAESGVLLMVDVLEPPLGGAAVVMGGGTTCASVKLPDGGFERGWDEAPMGPGDQESLVGLTEEIVTWFTDRLAAR